MGSNLGNRFECFNCRTKFYDLCRAPAICPKCGSAQEEVMKSGDIDDRRPLKGKKGGADHFDGFEAVVPLEDDDLLKDGGISLDLKAGL